PAALAPAAVRPLLERRPRDRQPGMPVGHVDDARAVEGVRPRPTPPVRLAALRQSIFENFLHYFIGGRVQVAGLAERVGLGRGPDVPGGRVPPGDLQYLVDVPGGPVVDEQR